MRRENRECFPRQHGLAIPTRLTPRAWRKCHDACRDHKLAVWIEVGGGENGRGIPWTSANLNFKDLVRGPRAN